MKYIIYKKHKKNKDEFQMKKVGVKHVWKPLDEQET